MVGSVVAGGDDRPTTDQVAAPVDLVRWLDDLYGIDSVVVHNDVVTGTECPGDHCEVFIRPFDDAVQDR